jgi:glycosyltransferase involved in cell wall biosynthesis
MNHTLKVSVIVAAYNAERYIKRCLDSLLTQTMPDFEVIVVDDGSRDGTPAILDEYSTRDSRVRVIHKENGGVASARQAGLDAAKGEYTIHADADDWVEPEMLEEMYEMACSQKADMVICDYYEVFDSGEKLNVQRPYPEDRLSVFGQMLNNLAGSLCNKLIRRSCYTDFNITFESGVNHEEDKLVCLKVLAHDVVVFYLGRAFYHYDHTGNVFSISTGGRPAGRLAILKSIADYTDIRSVQSYFDRAILYLAYQAMTETSIAQAEFTSLFKAYTPNIRRAKGFPLRVKVLVLLRLCGIDISLDRLKQFFHK